MALKSREMKTKPTRVHKPDDKEQSRLFIKKACEISADEGKSLADDLIGQLAKKPPEPRQKKDN